MTTVQQGPRAVAARLAAEVFSKGDLEVFEELPAGEYVNHGLAARAARGRKGGELR
jgi:hypothetical protein